MNKSKWNNYIQRAILCAAFTGVLMLVLFCASRIVERKESAEKNGSFLTEAAAGHIDGLLIGSSHVINGINPAQIYEETGCTVYNLGGHGSTLPVTYWTLVNALDYCTPRVVFVDTYMVEKDYQYLDINVEGDDHHTDSAVDQLHEVMDVFPDTANKRAAVADLIQDPETRLEFSADFIKYHSRWSSLTRKDLTEAFHVESTTLMGAEMRYAVTDEVSHYGLLPADDMDTTETVGKAYLRRIIELCQSRGIVPVIIQVPFEEDPEFQRAANSCRLIADEYGIPFVNLRYVENLINDYSDLQSQTHLSAYGACKVTQYFGAHTLQDLGLSDHRGESGYAAWESAAVKWHEEILEAATDPHDLYAALMLLQFEDVTSKVVVREDSTLFQDSVLAQTLADLEELGSVEVQRVSQGDAALSDADHPDDAVVIEVYSSADGRLLATHHWTEGEWDS